MAAQHEADLAPSRANGNEEALSSSEGRSMGSTGSSAAKPRERVGHALDNFASALDGAESELQDGRQSYAGRLVGDASRKLKKVARTVREGSFEDLVAPLRSFARERPVLFAGTALLVGFVIGRTLQLSRPESEPDTDDFMEQGA